MKTVHDIPAGVTFDVRWATTPGKGIEIGFVNSDGSTRFDLGTLIIQPVGNGSIFVMAENIQAGDGWGPFLVDVAMEYVTAAGKKLYPHPLGILPVAKRMWKVYYNDRVDVIHFPLSDEEIAYLHIQHSEPELRCAYQKAGSPIIGHLIAIGIWNDEIGRV